MVFSLDVPGKLILTVYILLRYCVWKNCRGNLRQIQRGYTLASGAKGIPEASST